MFYWVIAAVALTGVVLNIYQRKACFVLWSITNATWCIRNFAIKEYPQAVLFGIYFLLALWGLYQWTKKKSS